MRRMLLSNGLLASCCLLLLPFTAVSFAPGTHLDRRVAVPSALEKRTSRQQRSPIYKPLQYRALDEDDDDTALLQMQNRAPPGYNMRKALSKPPKTAMNIALILVLLLNQGFILVVATIAAGILLFTTDGSSAFSDLSGLLNWSGSFSGNADVYSPFLVGALGALPMLALSNTIENSDNRAFTNVNFSTIVMVMTLFGRRKVPPDDFIPEKRRGQPIPTTSWSDAAFQSFVLAGATGICEETVFRLEIPSLIAHYAGGNPIVSLVGQAILFGLGHAQGGGTTLTENGIVVGLQAINGLWLGLLYLFTGGDIIACMVAHALYDFTVFFKTWMDSNGQVEYAESMYSQPLPANIEQEVQALISSGYKIDPRVLKTIKRLFYTFDFDKNKTLSLSEVRKGVSYLALEKAGIPPPQEEVDALFAKCVESRSGSSMTSKNRLSFSDFLRLYAMSEKARLTSTA